MFICLDAHDPLTIVDTKDGVIEQQPAMSMNNIMSKGYKVLGLTYKNNTMDVDKKLIGSSLRMEVLNPRESFKQADLIIIRNREAGMIVGIKTTDGKEAFRTADKKFVDADVLGVNYLKQTELNYIVTFAYDGNSEVVTYVNGKRQAKVVVPKGEPRINVNRKISAGATESKKFNKSIAQKCLEKMNLKVSFIEDKDYDTIKGYLFQGPDAEYWILSDGRIYRGSSAEGNFKNFYRPDALKQQDKEENIKKLRDLIVEYNKASAMCEAEAKGMERAICEKLGVQRIVQMKCYNGYADLIVVIEDAQKKARLDLRSCKLQVL